MSVQLWVSAQVRRERPSPCSGDAVTVWKRRAGRRVVGGLEVTVHTCDPHTSRSDHTINMEVWRCNTTPHPSTQRPDSAASFSQNHTFLSVFTFLFQSSFTGCLRKFLLDISRVLIKQEGLSSPPRWWIQSSCHAVLLKFNMRVFVLLVFSWASFLSTLLSLAEINWGTVQQIMLPNVLFQSHSTMIPQNVTPIILFTSSSHHIRVCSVAPIKVENHESSDRWHRLSWAETTTGIFLIDSCTILYSVRLESLWNVTRCHLAYSVSINLFHIPACSPHSLSSPSSPLTVVLCLGHQDGVSNTCTSLFCCASVHAVI